MNKTINTMAGTESKVGVHREGSPYSEQECEEIISKLDELLDGELSETKEKEVIEMVNGCDYCMEQYKIGKSMRQLIKEGFKNVMVSANLIFNIKNRIRNIRNSQ